MKTSIVYVTTKVIVRHEDGVDPQDVIAQCNYDFCIEQDTGKETPKILDTEITDADTKGECHPTEHYLLGDTGKGTK